jgi:alpha-ribazole phosphatase
MRLLLIRHAKTDWNSQHRYQGHSDTPLNAQGQRQAAQVAKRLAKIRLDAAYTSDLSRARQTCAAILAHHPTTPFHLEPRLRELSFGLWEGLTYAEICERYPSETLAWSSGTDIPPPQGETLASLAERVGAFLAHLRQHYDEKKIILVLGHGGSLQVLLALALGLPAQKYWQFRLDPASLSDLSLYEGGGILASLNETAYLKED